MQITKIQKFGQLVRKTRKQQGLSQSELSAATGAGVRFIRELEQGKDSCHIGKAFMVCAMLGLDIQVNGESL